MNRDTLTLKNDPRRYQSRGAIGGSRRPADAASFDIEAQRERMERAVIDDRGYIHFVPVTRRASKD